MISDMYGPFQNTSTAYHIDSSGDKYYGKAPRGALTSSPRWQIAKMEYTGDNWIIKYPDGKDDPKNIWDNVESLSYKLLGT